MANTRQQLVPQKRLHEMFEYRGGELVWKEGHRTGSVAGYLEPNGYKTVRMQPKDTGLSTARPIGVHRLIFCYHHGYYPPQVDHINGVRADNRIENLRAALSHQNAANRARMSNNTTGVRGVRKHRDGHYEARVCFQGKRHQVGSFKTLEDAEAAVVAASKAIKGEWHCEGR